MVEAGMVANKPNIVSLFTGAGGLDYGFEAAGFRIAVALEQDTDCVETLGGNGRDWPIVDRDIHDLTSPNELLKAAGISQNEVHVVIGGPPCQPFSKAAYWANGHTLRLDDPRANTIGAFLAAIRDLRPQVVLLENVDALTYRGKDEGLQHLLRAFDQINREAGTRYDPKHSVLNAARFGVPQVRHRTFIVADRDGRVFRFPEATHSDNPQEREAKGLSSYATAWDAIGDFRGRRWNEDLSLGGKWAGLIPSIPEGENYLWHTEKGGGRPIFGWRTRYWSFLLKLAKSRPSWTIQAQPGPATGPFHWNNRLLSVRELCHLQTFPEDVEITGNRRSAQRQLGNAVPSLLAEVLAREIGTQLLDLPAHLKPPTLALPNRSSAPPPERRRSVPRCYEHLIGDHAPHPGSGKGPRAALREPAPSSA
jgi:DNA (cytosine-5)-methyltransferase 1